MSSSSSVDSRSDFEGVARVVEEVAGGGALILSEDSFLAVE